MSATGAGSQSGTATCPTWAEGSGLSGRIRDTLHSPTSLDRWARCPFSYFLGSILRIGSTESPEDVQTISALERGSLVHGILEDFVREARKESRIPPPGEPWSLVSRESLMRDRRTRLRRRGGKGRNRKAAAVEPGEGEHPHRSGDFPGR